eukprot:6208271-Pleurochrysis_carterae.AAC.3
MTEQLALSQPFLALCLKAARARGWRSVCIRGAGRVSARVCHWRVPPMRMRASKHLRALICSRA